MTADEALVGRAGELETLDRALADRRGVVLLGAAGVGKTRLARAALARAEQRGATTFWVAASKAAATIPFGAVAHLVPEGAGPDRLRELRRTEGRIAAAGGGAPVVLAVDDAHDLDDASATLVHRVALAGTAVVLATGREDAGAPDRVVSLWKDGGADRIDLGPLDRESTDELVAVLLDGPVEGVTRAHLWRLARGNPLYVRELVRGGLSSGALTADGGVWTWSGPVRAAPHLVTLVDHRVGDQSPEVRDAVDLVALGEPVAAVVLEGAGVAAETLDEAERRGLLRSGESPHGVEVRLAHPIVGEVSRGRLTPLRRRGLCRRLAGATAPGATGAGAVGAVRRAEWHLGGGLGDGDGGDVLVRGCRAALAALDLPLARRFAEGAAAASDAPATRMLLAGVLVLLGEGERAETVLAAVGTTGLTPAEHAELAVARSWNLAFALGRGEAARAVLAEAASAGAAGGPAGDGNDRVTIQRAMIDGYDGRVAAALVPVREVAGRAGPGPDPAALAAALVLITELATVAGRLDETRAAALRAERVLRDRHGGDWSIAQEQIAAGTTLAHLHGDDLEIVEPLVVAGLRRGADSGWRPLTAIWTSWAADLAAHRGRVRTALAKVHEASALTARGPQPLSAWMGRTRALQRARYAAMLGHVDEAVAALDEADRLDDGTNGLVEVWDGSAAAWVAAASGELTRATDTAVAAADRARRGGQLLWELTALHQVVRLGSGARVVERLEAVADRVDGRLAVLYGRHARAAAVGDGAALDAVARAFAGQGRRLLAAETAAQAASAYRAAGRSGAARAAGMRARELAAACEGACTPALTLLAQPDGLARRENEIARLAAAGLTNREIAGRLTLSVRTVDNVLHQVYAKLGVRGRTDLGRVFDVDGWIR